MAAPPKKRHKVKHSNPLGPGGKKFKKPSQERPPSIPPAISSALMDDEDGAPDFPRGGVHLLSRREVAEAQAEAEKEFHMEVRGGKKKLKKVNKRGVVAGGEDEQGSLFGEGISGKLPRFANRINSKNITVNMKLWGVVVEVNSKVLVIGLPGGMRGFVRAKDACDLFSLEKKTKDMENDMLSSLFHVGQLVPCVVIEVESGKSECRARKRVWLSLHLSHLHKGLSLDSLQDGMVLHAVVKSVEDHGYVLHFGTSFSGFLAKDQGDGVENRLKPCQLVQCVLNRIDSGRSFVYASRNTDLYTKSIGNNPRGLVIDSIVPGMMVSARLHAMLENGLMLSFLSYFTGTVDIFNLDNTLPDAAWKNSYHLNQKFNARILFIDPTTRAIGLTLNPHLMQNTAPPIYIKAGDIFDDSRIVRVDGRIGLLLEIPSIPEVTAAYVSRLDAADEEIKRLDKRFKENTQVRVHILGIRHMEGMVNGTLKASASKGSIFTHEDAKPGILSRAKVVTIKDHGAVVKFPSGVKALCPVSHMSEFEISKPSKKFKVGAELLFRVLGSKSRLITVTYKKTLVKSKLKVLASYADAVVGSLAHGWISKIGKRGCYLKFYNGVQAFAHKSDLGLEPGTEATSIYHVGQVVKCRIVSLVPSSKKIIVSFILSSKGKAETGFAKIGSHVSGVVTHLTNDAVIVESNTSHKGVIYNEHLSDHHVHIPVLKSLLKPGYKFDKLLVLDIEGINLVLSAKPSLLSFDKLPSDIKDLHPHSVVPGYICNLIETGCFVRFLGRLTGFSPKTKSLDEDIGKLSDVFYVGQSVRSYVAKVDTDISRVSLSLKQSYCSSTDASFIDNYFLMEEKISRLGSSSSGSLDSKKLRLNQVVEVFVQEKKEYGIVVNLLEHDDVVGFITNHQLGGRTAELGSTVKAVILDISVADNLVDLSLKSELLDSFGPENSIKVSSKKRRQREIPMVLHETKNTVVEMVKENYLVLSIPDCNNAIGYASLVDYNTQKFPWKNIVEGQTVLATIEALPSSSLCGRLLLLLKSLTGIPQMSSTKKAKKKSSYAIGTCVQAEITDICPTGIFLKFGFGCRGRVHITEVVDVLPSDNPLINFKVGQVLGARIIAKGGKSYQWEMTVKPSSMSDMGSMESYSDTNFNFTIGQAIGGYVTKVDKDWVSLAVSRSVSAQLYILDSSCDPNELEQFQTHHKIGMPITGYVIGIDREKRLLMMASQSLVVDFKESSSAEMVISGSGEEMGASDISVPKHILQGKIVGGRIKKILPGIGGVLVQIGPHLFGKVHFTDLVDDWHSNPLSGYQEGQFVKCRVLEVSNSSEGFIHIDLSLRASSVVVQSGISSAQGIMDGSQRYEKVEELHVGMDVKGYVKNISTKGCFIILSRKIDARVLISNLSDHYIEKPEVEFPIGKLVQGRVLSIEALSGRVDVTLKSELVEDASRIEFGNLHVGDVICGKIKRIEPYGLFISVNSSNVVGLCHISEISDDRIENLGSKFTCGDEVKAKILKVDPEKRRISLGIKDVHFVDTSDVSAPDFDIVQDLLGNKMAAISGASVPPLDVKLDDDITDSDMDNDTLMHENGADAPPQNGMRKLGRKEKEKREVEISASEERRLQNDMPRTADEFDKLVRCSPNSSFVWIKYMAFLLSLAEVEEARVVAERALRTINFREENEKLNVWVAYLNLENEYGNPPEEAVKKLFERALQFCDTKKLHIALLGIYQRSKQDELAKDLLQKMIKKFKHSCKIWLHHMENLLKQNEDEAQNAIHRALQSLPPNKHIKFMSQTAILEFRLGMSDRGRNLFEEILKEHPKRVDIWSIYIDKVIQLGDPEVTRSLFERVTCLSLAPKKLKFLFKKYLEYERSIGDEERVEYVKGKALEYVESAKA